jgi:DNA-binding transcriptional LysR family regulator
MITLKQLNHLQAICQYGTLHGAAKAVHLTHSALTRSLHNLEEALGISLFERHKTGMEPTEFCSKILLQSEQVLLAVKDIERDADLARNIEEGHLHIIVGPGTKGLVLRETLPNFFKQYPNIDIRITEAMPEDAKELLMKREADFLISGSGSFTGNTGLNIELIKPIPVQVLVRKDHPLVGQDITLAKLFTYPLVAASQLSNDHPFLKELAKKLNTEVNLTPKIICSDSLILKSILKKTDAWAGSLSLELNLEDGELVSLGIDQLSLTNNLSVIELVGRSRSPAAQKFLDICKAHFDALEI